MNKYVVSYIAEVQEDLEDGLICAGERIEASIFDLDAAEYVCAESFFEAYLGALNKLEELFEGKADITITGIMFVRKE
ncbi:MAG: hypothetical protein E7679_04770 [Ruminococcaceae bacterium]|nr:hypothetical protein [Oscillospiraceae bacterium]